VANIENFDAIADDYDTSERVQVAKLCAEAIRGFLPRRAKSKTAVDFGCGTGLVGLELVNEFRATVFIDASENMVRRVLQKTSGLGNASALCVDLENAKRLPVRADCILAVQVLLHIRGTDAILAKLRDSLNDGGRLIVVDFVKTPSVKSDLVHNGFDVSGFGKSLEAIGFTDIASRVFYMGEKIFMGQDASLFVIAATKQGG
jgi:predicted TPR repeat methyltransferase